MADALQLDKLGTDDFSVSDFVERIALSAKVGDVTSVDHPQSLLDAFDLATAELWQSHEQVEEQVAQLELLCRNKEERHTETFQAAKELMQDGYDSLQSLTEGIHSVSLKIVHVGDQLESYKLKRDRCIEAATLMKHYASFDSSDKPLLPPLDRLEDPFVAADDGMDRPSTPPPQSTRLDLSSDPDAPLLTDEELAQGANTLQQLVYLAPDNDRVARAKDKLEELVLERFKEAIELDQVDAMVQLAIMTGLYLPERHSDLVKAYIDFVVRDNMLELRDDPLLSIPKICHAVHGKVNQVFESTSAMTALFQTLCKKHLKPFVLMQVQHETDPLPTVHKLYVQTRSVLSSLCQELGLSGGAQFGLQLTRAVFAIPLETHFAAELNQMLTGYGQMLEDYYSSIGHERHSVNTNSPRSPRKHARQKSTDVPLDPTQTLLSDDLAAEMLYECRRATERCQALSPLKDAPQWPLQLFSRLLAALCKDHMKYALDVAQKFLPSKKPKAQPAIYFFDIIADVNKIFYLLQKFFQDCMVPVIRDDFELYLACLNQKNEVMEDLETSLAGGLETCLEAIVEWTRVCLTKDRPKTEYKPTDTSAISLPCTPACTIVTNFLNQQIRAIKASLNGKNLTNVFRLLGTRLHKVIYDNIKTFTYNDIGGMLLSRDLNCYEQVLRHLDDVYVNELMDVLKELSTLLIVRADNIPQLCNEGRIETLDQAIVMSFLQLRTDFKSAKLGTTSMLKA
eukprot:TRINITY_DN8536_c0_g1_i1.p1 TRINITY_DN8536_c0_g1~~TRINITY_DN8536_c0_g1_i1.p1  ORF type:complete len:737 (+),score=186.14 TRINITY_DN8536_c0_g1_i1:3-2213(+)